MSWAFPRGDDIIMAVDAATNDICMIKYGAKPGKGSVAIVAYIAALDMTLVFTRGDDAVMTTLTTANHRKMIDLENISPASGLVTEITVLSGRNVLR